MRRSLVTSILALIATSVQAGTGLGRITGYVPSTSGGNPEFVLISVETISGTPACNTTARFGISSTDPKYKTVVASIIAAYQAIGPCGD